MADRLRTALLWEDVPVFLALARHGSLSAAARALSVNHATIARRIASLEHGLGEKLVERRPGGYMLTAAGNRALAAASEMETAAANLIRNDDPGTGPRGLVRVNTTTSLAQGFLVAQLGKLTAQHAGLDIEVATDIRLVSLERREADIAVRLGRPRDGDVIAKRLATFGFGFYAAPQWQRRLQKGAAPVFVGFDEANGFLPEAAWLARRFARARVALRTSNQIAQAAAAKAGAGVALLPHFIGRGEARLQRCTLGPEPPARELWSVTRRQDARDLSIRLVVDFLAQVFRDQRALFED
jgi:molybdate transport repressor ModE-like protein